jgi:aminoglycoside phosphotransferase (APT) family kinase protein
MDAHAVARLSSWLDEENLHPGETVSIEPLVGGTSNVMFSIGRSSSKWVLRRPANIAIDRANEGMRREYRILDALGKTDVPHPKVVALCDDVSVLGCTFYLMQWVEGVNPFPAPHSFGDDRRRAEITFALVDALASLHEVDYGDVGLGDLGHPELFHERQVERWSRQLASYQGRDLPGIERVMEWLERNRPNSFLPALMHGDYHMRNTMIATDPPARVVAILDWETATIGDPLLDLVGFCEVWCRSAQEGWPTRADMIDRYQSTRRITWTTSLTYYEVLYNFRLAVLVEGIYQRSLRDEARRTQDDMGEFAQRSVARAMNLVSGIDPD